MNRASAATPIAPSAEAAPAIPWRAAGAAVTGVSHVRLGLPCQDAQGFAVHADGALLVAVADGAGSAKQSDLGAQAAVAAALSAMQAALNSGQGADGKSRESLLRDVFSEARAAVLRLTGGNGAVDSADAADADFMEPVFSPRDYACTLTCAIAADGWLAVGQVGDGAVIAMDEQDTLFAVTRLQRGEYANETHFLVQEDALDQLIIEVVEQPVRGVAVMSDGLIRLALKLPTQEPHAPFFQPLFRFAESIQDAGEASTQLAAFLDSERVNARTDDDKSLVLAVRASAQAAGTAQPREKAAGVSASEAASQEAEGE